MINIGKVYTDLSPLGKGLLISALVLVFIALMDGMVLGPILSQMKVMDAEIEAKKETVRRNLRIISFEDRISDEYATYREYLDSGAKSQEEIIGALLRKIETFAAQQEISIINVRPGDVIQNPVFQEYKTGLECEGTLTNLLAFMNLLEESDYLFQITKYQMIPKSKSGEKIKCNMDISRILVTVEKDNQFLNDENRLPQEEPAPVQPLPPPPELPL